jgi:DNA repair/transcription protein MET18/MMS19
MFSHDHKAGIEASTRALQSLSSMKGFTPAMGVKIIEDMLKIEEDFSKQIPATRHAIFKLLLRLIEIPSVRSDLQHQYGHSAGFLVDLLQLCQRERDPKNLLVWFSILKTLLQSYTMSQEVTEGVFHAFSNYFPISLNKHATPLGVTTDDLKLALRACFASHSRLAPWVFPFLIERLDRGESLITDVEAVSVKVGDLNFNSELFRICG